MARSFFEKRRNEKALRQVQEIEQRKGREISSFAVQGTQRFEWSGAATVVFAVFVVMFVVAALLGYVILPGGLVLFAGYNAVKPRRTVSLGHETVTVWEHGFWTAKITGIVTTQHRSQLQLGKFVTVPGAVPIKLSSTEQQLVADYNNELGVSPARIASVPPPPSSPNPLWV